MARGIQHFGAFGADTAAGDVLQCDPFQGTPTVLNGSADAINPYSTTNNYIITSTGVDACTLPLPISGTDDNLTIAVWSASAHAHSITLPSAAIANGAASAKTTAALAAFAGAGIILRAWQGTWQVTGSVGTVSYS